MASPQDRPSERLIDRIGPDGPWIALAIACFVGWGFKAHCGAAWTASEQYVTGCYSDAVPFWGLRGVAAGQIPYLEARMEYPVLTGLLIWIEGFFARLLAGSGADALDFLRAVLVGSIVLAGAILAMMRRAGVSLARQYAWALAPPLMLYWTTRLWMKAQRGEVHDDPVVFAARDWQSLAVLVLMGASFLMAMSGISIW